MGKTMNSNGKPGLDLMKASYRTARINGDNEEEAKWANQIGHAYKDRGEYVKALEWFRKDYEISCRGDGNSESVRLMPTCQSIGEVYFRLQLYDEALDYQLKHVQLAKESGSIVEQQRARTQLGRTYLELYELKDRLSALTDAKLNFELSLEFAERLRSNSTSGGASPSAFVVELVDAYNNLGLVWALAEDYKEAYRYYSSGLNLCDEEEVNANNAARSRIHHNLGRLYADLRDWEKSERHTEMDISICQKIPHPQGEAKGLMNLADLHFKCRDYEKAVRCYKRALNIAQKLEDEDNLVKQIKDNIEIMGKAKAMSKTFDVEMQRLSKFRKEVEAAKGTATERNVIKQECKLLQELIGQAYDLQAWDVHLGLAKRLKTLTKDLGDRERLGDALEIVAFTYYNLRKFEKAIKWHSKSFEQCKRIGHLEGQIVAKINYGNALDASGKSRDALKAYQEALEAANTRDTPKMVKQQIGALENIHYCFLVRLNLPEDARKVEHQLNQLKHVVETSDALDDREERCSETGSERASDESQSEPEAEAHASHRELIEHPVKGRSRVERISTTYSQRSKFVISNSSEEDDDAPLSTLRFQNRVSLRRRRMSINIIKRRNCGLLKQRDSRKRRLTTELKTQARGNHNGLHEEKSCNDGSRSYRADRRRIVLSDDEMSEASLDMDGSDIHISNLARESVVLEDRNNDVCLNDMGAIGGQRKRPPFERQRERAPVTVSLSSDEDIPTSLRKKVKPSNPSSKKPSSSNELPKFVEDCFLSDNDFAPTASDVPLPSDTPNISTPLSPNSLGILGSTSSLRVTALCPDKCDELIPPISTPVMQNVRGLGLTTAGKHVEVISAIDPKQTINASEVGAQFVSRIVQDSPKRHCVRSDDRGLTSTPLMQHYLKHCKAAAISPNAELVEKLRTQKVSEEVVVAGSNIEDLSARPLLAALRESDAFSLLDLSHNLLGNATVHSIQELIKSTNQTDLGLTLDLHCNKLGAGALLQICRCPVSLSRLEVLNLSGNRLTDAAARHLSIILRESQALATLNLDSCALTTRAVNNITSALHPGSLLAKLCIGNNNPIAGFAVQELLHKLSTIKSFAELDMNGVELDDNAVAGVATLLQNSKTISALSLGGTDIRNDAAIVLSLGLHGSLRLTKLDLSRNAFNMEPALNLCSQLMSIHSLTSLNLCGNQLDQKAVDAISRGLAGTSCRLKVLDLSYCHLGRASVLYILFSLSDQDTLLDLNLAGNIHDLKSSNLQPVDGGREEVSEGPTESTFAKTPLDDSVESSCPTVESLGKGCAYPVHENENMEFTGVPRVPGLSDEISDPSLRVDTEMSGQINLTNGKSVQVPEDPHMSAGPGDCVIKISDNVEHLHASKGPPGNLLGKPETNPETPAHQPSEAACSFAKEVELGRCGLKCDEELVTEIETTSAHSQSVFSQPESKSADSLLVEDLPTTSVTRFFEQLASAIQTAQGLRLLNLSDNKMPNKSVEKLFLAWSAGLRGCLVPIHHIQTITVHFFVEGRPCPCADPPCCTLH